MNKLNSVYMRLICLASSAALALTLAGPFYTAQAQSKRTGNLNDPQEFESYIDPIFVERMEKSHIPGAVIIVVKDGKVFFSKGYGYANLERKSPVIPDRTIFRIGSITKVFTATAVMQLADKGKINLSDDVNKYLKDFKVESTYPRPVTFANLLTHTAGFEEINIGRKVWSQDKVIPLNEFLKSRLIRRRPPGEVISYSTYGVTLAGYLVEAISGTPFKEYLNKNIFQPLDMARTSMASVPPGLQQDLATGYAYSNGAYRPLGIEYFHTYPASDINSTATDMAHFMLSHLNGGRYGRARILSETATRKMHATQFRNDPRLVGFTYGFFESTRHGYQGIQHLGSMEGFHAMMYMWPKEKIGIFVACNREAAELQDVVLKAFMDRYLPAPKSGAPVPQSRPVDELERFAGTYKKYCPCTGPGLSTPPFEITVNADGTLSMWGGRWVQVEPLLFKLTNGQLDTGERLIAFKADSAGRITRITSGTVIYDRLPSNAQAPTIIKLDPQIYRAYTGQYELGPGQVITITVEGDKLMGGMNGQPKVDLSALSETRFIAKAADAEVRFIKDERGEVTHLVLLLNGQEMRAKKIK